MQIGLISGRDRVLAPHTLTVNVYGAQAQPLDEERLMTLIRRAEALAGS